MARPKSKPSAKSSASLGFEAKLWLTADKLRNNMDAAEYKHVVLGLIFLKYISDTFEEHRAKLMKGGGDYAGANPEDPDEYKAENVFWVTIDWTLRESARAKIKVMVKRILNKYGYPPDSQEEAVKTVLAQAELLCADWVVNSDAT
ncbi:MAG: type I restriction enzyme endonuclease domain-containing protein [Steroidobacteraceae bacterium]